MGEAQTANELPEAKRAETTAEPTSAPRSTASPSDVPMAPLAAIPATIRVVAVPLPKMAVADGACQKSGWPVAQPHFDEMLESVAPGPQDPGAHHAHPPEKECNATEQIDDNSSAWIQFISTRPWQRPRLHIGEEFHGFHDAFLHTIT